MRWRQKDELGGFSILMMDLRNSGLKFGTKDAFEKGKAQRKRRNFAYPRY